MMRLKTKSKAARPPATPSASASTPLPPGRTLVFTSSVSHEASTTIDYLPALDMAPAQHDFFYGLEDELFRTSTGSPDAHVHAPHKDTLCVEQYHFHSRQPTPSPSVLRELHQRNHSTNSTSSAPSTASDDSTDEADDADDADDDASDQGFDDLPEDSGSPIHAMAPLWSWQFDEPARAVHIVHIGKPTLVDITLSAMAKKRRLEMTPGARRPEKRWAQSHLRQLSDESTATASSGSSAPSSPTSTSDHSTPATSGAEESDSCAESISSHYETPAAAPAFLKTDPSAAPPRIPVRSQHRIARKAASISVPGSGAGATLPPRAPTRPAPTIPHESSPDSSFETQRPPIPTRRWLSDTKVKQARSSPRRKSISTLLSMNQNVLT